MYGDPNNIFPEEWEEIREEHRVTDVVGEGEPLVEDLQEGELLRVAGKHDVFGVKPGQTAHFKLSASERQLLIGSGALEVVAEEQEQVAEQTPPAEDEQVAEQPAPTPDVVPENEGEE